MTPSRVASRAVILLSSAMIGTVTPGKHIGKATIIPSLMNDP